MSLQIILLECHNKISCIFKVFNYFHSSTQLSAHSMMLTLLLLFPLPRGKESIEIENVAMSDAYRYPAGSVVYQIKILVV